LASRVHDMKAKTSGSAAKPDAAGAESETN
jgi:hypothetical protein